MLILASAVSFVLLSLLLIHSRKFALFFLFLFLNQLGHANEEEYSDFMSTPEQITALTEHSDNLVGGVISPLGGLPTLCETDLVAQGAQNVIVSRLYLSHGMPCHFHDNVNHDQNLLLQYLNKHYQGWVTFPHKEIRTANNHAFVTTPSGVTLKYLMHPEKCTLRSKTKGMNNLSNDQVSGVYDLRNILVEYSSDYEYITVRYPDGLTCHYQRMGKINGRPSPHFLLTKEALPNGKIIKYIFEARKLVRVQSMDRSERYIYAFIDIHYSNDGLTIQHLSNTGSKAVYYYQQERREGKYKLQFPLNLETFNIETAVSRLKSPEAKKSISYSHVPPPILTSVDSPLFQTRMTHCPRFFLDLFKGRDDHCKLLFGGFGDKAGRHYRVLTLSKPQSEGNFQEVARFDYTIPPALDRHGKRVTRIRHGDGTLTIYQFNENLLPTSIQYCGTDDSLCREKLYQWDANNRLQTLEIRDRNVLHMKKSYEYDRFGNPVVERIFGDLCGENREDVYTIKREYSQEGRHLLLREEEEEGLTYTYKYRPHTNLLIEKLTWDSGKIVHKELYEYDDCDNLITTITDDGTQRTIKRYTLRQSQPFLHKIETLEECYVEQDQEKLLRKTTFEYDRWGNISETYLYDAEGELVHHIQKTYNERGDLLSETDPEGKKAQYSYDSRGLNTVAINFSGNIRKEASYDPLKRIVEEKETGFEGIEHRLTYQYDIANRIINAQDIFGNKTHYSYDPLVNKAIHVERSAINSIPIVSLATYNSLGFRTSSTDPNGNLTRTKYNARGRPVEITHPDGSKECWRYTKKGLLSRHTDQEGITTLYHYDTHGRIISQYCMAFDGTIFGNQSFIYRGLKLASEVDTDGKITYYLYDGAGRKISEEYCGKLVRYSYDTRGRLSTTINNDGHQNLILLNEYDSLNRLVSKTKWDSFKNLLYKISYEYDADNNKIGVIRQIEEKPAHEKFVYDSFKRLIRHTDALGNIKTTSYNESCINKFGQRVLQTSTVNPDGVCTLKTEDTAGNLVKKEIFKVGEILVSAVDYFYDNCFNLVEQQDHDYKHGEQLKTQTVQYQYTNTNKVQRITRAAGTEKARITSCTYTPSGRIATKTLPDLTVLNYFYTYEGFLKKLCSSDGRLNHVFEYTSKGKLLAATDEVQNIKVERELDLFGNVISEKFSTGVQIDKSYDLFDRLSSLRIASVGEWTYTYDPLYLKSIARWNRGEKLYEHRYTSYDLNGYLLNEELPNNLGSLKHTYTPAGRVKNIISPYFSESYDYDSCQRLSQKVQNSECWNYAYDPLSQLTQERNEALNAQYEYAYDALFNRTQKNEEAIQHNELNEVVSQGEITCQYDLNGNLTEKKKINETFYFSYDPLNRLTDATSSEYKIHFAYDPLGRRLSKTVERFSSDGTSKISHENYIYSGMEEIGAFVDGKPKQLRVLGNEVVAGMAATVAMELDGKVLSVCSDLQGNIRRLVDIKTQKILADYQFTGFGEIVFAQGPLAQTNPWSFANKRFDEELHLVYYGHRYYDSELARWLSTDPEEFHDSMNLYQYLLNNPYSYVDPDGRFAVVLILFSWGGSAAWTALTAITAQAALEMALMAVGSYAAIKGGEAVGTMIYHDVAAIYANSTEDTNVHPIDTKPVEEENYDDEVFVPQEDSTPSDKGNRIQPHKDATGDHSTFRRNPETGLNDYHSYRPQRNPQNPNKWETTKKFHHKNNNNQKKLGHRNKATGKQIPEPHVHDPLTPGGVRIPEPWEIPPGWI